MIRNLFAHLPAAVISGSFGISIGKSFFVYAEPHGYVLHKVLDFHCPWLEFFSKQTADGDPHLHVSWGFISYFF